MARKIRLYYPGAIYHVMLRGNAGQAIFFSDADREYFYSLLAEGVDRFGYRIYGFCLMTNHVHIAVRMGNISLSKGVQNLSFRYAKYINQKQKRVGHLFQGRHRAILVDGDHYLLDLIRYIHFNPVRANMVTQPEHYKWSSHGVYLGRLSLSWLTCSKVLELFSGNRETALLNYQKFMLMDVDLELREKFQIGNHKKYSVLGEDHFLDQIILKKHEQILCLTFQDIIRLSCLFFSMDESILCSKSRNRLTAKIRAIIGLLVQDFKIDSLTSVAKYFNRDVSGLIRTMQRIVSDTNEVKVLNTFREYIQKSIS